MRHWISLFIIIFSSVAFGEDKTTLYDFRYWSAPDHTRIVIDKEEDTLFNITSSDDYVIISFDDAEVLSETFSNIFFKDDRIQKVRIKREKSTIKLIVHINRKFNVKALYTQPKQQNTSIIDWLLMLLTQRQRLQKKSRNMIIRLL